MRPSRSIPAMTKQHKRRLPQRPIAAEDLLRFRIVSDPQIAPDGRRMVFVENHVGPQNNYVSNLWIVDVEAAGRQGPARRAGASSGSLDAQSVHGGWKRLPAPLVARRHADRLPA